MEIVFIRHGESQANMTDRDLYGFFCGRYDCDLTEAGIKEAEKIKGEPVLGGADAVFASPLKRAIKTACLACDISEKDIIIDERITERTMGDFDGQKEETIRSDPRYKKYFEDPDYMDFRHSFTVKAQNGENFTDVEKRVTEFLNDVKRKGYKKIIVVSHSCAIRCFLRVILGLSEEETLKTNVKQCQPIMVEV